MSEIPAHIPDIPPVFGVAVACVLLGLLIRKEMLRAVGQPGLLRHGDDPAPAHRWGTVENWLVAVLFVLFGLILLARLLSFAA